MQKFSFSLSLFHARTLWLAGILLLLTQAGFAQSDSIRAYRLDTLRFFDMLREYTQLAETEPRQLEASEVVSLPYQKRRSTQMFPVPLRLMEKNMVLRFRLYNPEDRERKLYFTPGLYYRNLQFFKAKYADIAGSVERIPDSTIRSSAFPAGKYIVLSPGEDAVFFVSINFIKTNANSYSPQLIEKDFITYWLKNKKFWDPNSDMITFIISGILLLMIFYSIAAYLQNRNREFIYYSVYAACSAVLFFLKSFNAGSFTAWNFFYEEFLDFIILGLGVIFYLTFMRRFLNTPRDYPWLDRFLHYSVFVLAAMLLLYSGAFYFTKGYQVIYVLENLVTKIVMFIIGIVFIVYGLRRRDKLMTYLVWGNVALLVFSLLSLLTFFDIKLMPSYKNSVLNRGLILYEIGVVLELAFFLSGLAYKNRRDLTEKIQEQERLKLDNERKEFEKQIAIVTTRQEERDRISADMHDELGSGMTAIRLMSEIMRAKMKDQAYPELEKISNSANDLLGKMNSIIWTMKSSNDTLESLVAYVRSHALEYFDTTPVLCRVKVPDHIPQVEMSGEKRRNIFLSVKESFHNILKHAQASEVSMELWIEKDKLVINVKDNGVGIDSEKLRRFGNGLSNMKRRMESIGGEFHVQSGEGTTLTFTAPL